VVRRGGGGLVSALSGPANQLDDAVWVRTAITDEDVAVSGAHGYVALNERMAGAVAEELEARGGRGTVPLQDYHLYLYLVPRLVQERCPLALLHHFVHIPWPQPDTGRDRTVGPDRAAALRSWPCGSGSCAPTA